MNKLGSTLKLLARRIGGRSRRDGRSAALVRGLAGMPAGVEPGRRGTVLILVIGALALIAVITLVYATIGQSDIRQSEAAVRRGDTAGVSDAVGACIARG